MNPDMKQKFWQDHLEQCARSTMSQREYCRQHNLALSTYGYWKRRLSQPDKNPVRFYPLVVSDSPDVIESSGLLLFINERRFCIELSEQFSVSTLQKLVGALEEL